MTVTDETGLSVKYAIQDDLDATNLESILEDTQL